jgi:hypothetical protein
MRRLLEPGRARPAAIDHLELLLERAIALGEQIDLVLLAHDRLTKLLQRALQMSELGLDEFESAGFSHGRTPRRQVEGYTVDISYPRCHPVDRRRPTGILESV